MDFPTQKIASWSKHVLDIVLSIFFITPPPPPPPPNLRLMQGIKCNESVFSHLGEQSEGLVEKSSNAKGLLSSCASLLVRSTFRKSGQKNTKAGSAHLKPFVSLSSSGPSLSCLPASQPVSPTQGGCRRPHTSLGSQSRRAR